LLPISKPYTFIGDDVISFGSGFPSKLYGYDLESANFYLVSQMSSTSGQWIALFPTRDSAYPFVIVQEVLSSPNTGYIFQCRRMDSKGSVTNPLGNTIPDFTFVNFFWADFDQSHSLLYLLVGDEDSIDDLDAILQIFDLTSSKVRNVTLDNSKYTISSFHVDQRTGKLYALSPGLVPGAGHDWSLVTINPANGNINLVSQLTSKKEYTNYYGGSIYGPVLNGQIFHIFHSSLDRSLVLHQIDIDSGKSVFSTEIDVGVNHFYKLFAPVFVPPSP